MSVNSVKTVDICTLAPSLLLKRDTLAIAGPLDGVCLPSCVKLIVLDGVAGNKDTVGRDTLTGLEEGGEIIDK